VKKRGLIGINADSGTLNGDLNTLESMLIRFQKAGFEAVELPVHGLQLVLNGKVDQTQLMKVKRILARYPFHYTMHGIDSVNLLTATHQKEHLTVTNASLEAAAALEIGILVFHSSRAILSDQEERQQWQRRWRTTSLSLIREHLVDLEAEQLHELGENALKHHVIIAIENNFDDASGETFSYGTSGKNLAHLVEKVNHPFIGITYDVGHGYLSSHRNGFDLLEDMAQALPHIKHLHLHDNFGKRPEAQDNHRLRAIDRIPFGWGDLHLPVGQGSIPYDAVSKLLKNVESTYCLELEPRYADQYEEQISYVRTHFF